MSSRKQQLRSMFGQSDTSTPAMDEAGQGPRRAVSGSVRAMGLSLDALTDQVAEAHRLRDSVVRGAHVVEVDPLAIDPSPFADRLSQGADDEGFAALKESIRDGGQQVPVLVRPHIDEVKAAAGRYQSAYGHRRIQAARQLGIPVKAIVRNLSDEELAIAQGRENADRRDLSFIERATFARRLIGNGFDRAAVQMALSVHKSEMTRLLQVAEAVPERIAKEIGAAPKVGRPRWLALGALLAKEGAHVKAEGEFQRPEFRSAGSDHRFAMLFKLLSHQKSGTKVVAAEPIKATAGPIIGAISPRGAGSVISIEAEAGEGFGAFVADRLPALHAEFRAANRKAREPVKPAGD